MTHHTAAGQRAFVVTTDTEHLGGQLQLDDDRARGRVTGPREGFPKRRDRGQNTRRSAFVLPAAPLLALSLSSPAHAIGYGEGDVSKGEFQTELYRGAAVPFELTVVATPNDCEGSMDLAVAWDEKKNEVTVELSGDNVLEPYPDIDRTDGINYTYNPFFPEPEDFQDGRYQLWVISGGGPVTVFYYDPATANLLGSQYDFETPPAAIPVPFPTLYMFATPLFQPDANGSVDESWEFAYDGLLRGDRPEFSHHIVTFPPPNLCGANPNRLDLSTLRPYISDPLPASEARPWSDYLRSGLLFDVTIEPGEYYQEPPLTRLTATYSGATGVPGGIPRGWNFDIDAAFMGVAPPIRPWAGAGSCEDVYAGIHTTGLDVCGGGE